MQIDSEEISEFVKAVLTGIDAGLTEEYSIATPVKFQFGLKSKKDRGGKISLSIAGIGASRSNEDVARIEFEVDSVISVIISKIEEWRNTQTGKEFLELLAKEMQKSS